MITQGTAQSGPLFRALWRFLVRSCRTLMSARAGWTPWKKTRGALLPGAQRDCQCRLFSSSGLKWMKMGKQIKKHREIQESFQSIMDRDIGGLQAMKSRLVITGECQVGVLGHEMVAGLIWAQRSDDWGCPAIFQSDLGILEQNQRDVSFDFVIWG